MERKSRKNRRMSDGKKNKTIKSKYGESLIEVPQDREGTFEPKVVKKRQKDILILCADGLTGMKEAVTTAFPKTEYQCCIVHQVRNTLKYVGDKDKKLFANDLKTIYQAPSEKVALEKLSIQLML